MIGNRATSRLLDGAAPAVPRRHLARQPGHTGDTSDPVQAARAKLAALAARKAWQALATELATFSDADIPGLIPAMSHEAFGDFMNFLLNHSSAGNDRVFARAQFLTFQKEHPGERPSENVKIVKGGKAGRTLAVPGGEVVVHTGERFDAADPSRQDFHNVGEATGYSVSYKGKDSERSRWIQFVWFDAIAEGPGRRTGGEPLAFEIPAAAFPLHSTTDRGDQSVIVDARRDTPFYEDGGASNRTKDSTTIFDAPTSESSQFEKVFSGSSPATKVTATAHMIQYLVRDDQVLCRVNLEVKWVLTDTKVPPPTFSEPRLAPVTHLVPAHRRALRVQFPHYVWIP
jgi:hypothetical protein